MKDQHEDIDNNEIRIIISKKISTYRAQKLSYNKSAAPTSSRHDLLAEIADNVKSLDVDAPAVEKPSASACEVESRANAFEMASRKYDSEIEPCESAYAAEACKRASEVKFYRNAPAMKQEEDASAEIRFRRNRMSVMLCVAIICGFALICFWIVSSKSTDDSANTQNAEAEEELIETVTETQPATIAEEETAGTATGESAVTEAVEETSSEEIVSNFVVVSDTIIAGKELKLLYPGNLTPSLCIGAEVFGDSTAMMAFEAADFRADNGGIVGSFVADGELLGKGQSKSGFCAIIDSKMTIGVADSTPYLEQAIESDGYFFRQYPLVVANQPVVNKPKGASLRKALAEIGGETVVVLSKQRLTYDEFSNLLVELGVTNAITLVGGGGPGFAVTEDARIEYSRQPASNDSTAGLNFIVWR